VASAKDPYVKQFKQEVLEFLRGITDYIAVNPGAIPDSEMKIQIKPAFEIGEKQKRVHAHISILIEHNSNIKLDVQKITADTGWYVNSRYVRGSRDLDRILEYLRKQQ
jgi:hypothetical protein